MAKLCMYLAGGESNVSADSGWYFNFAVQQGLLRYHTNITLPSDQVQGKAYVCTRQGDPALTKVLVERYVDPEPHNPPVTLVLTAEPAGLDRPQLGLLYSQ